MRLLIGVVLACGGCDLVFPAGEALDAAAGTDGAPGDGIGIPPGGFPHLPPAIVVGDEDVRIAVATTIDTTTLEIVPMVAGVTISAIPQSGGPGLMVLAARDLAFAAPVTVRGERGLVVVGRAITVDALVDASAALDNPGPGAQTAGTGAGGPGLVAQSGTSVAGGGGGAFGPGARSGGAASTLSTCMPLVAGGEAGVAVTDSDLVVLQGGAPGGAGQRCLTFGGGGGGAIQLSATATISVTGAITANGGGGNGGALCVLADGGAGGGAGGGVYLDAPTIDIAGGAAVAANGGGGGGGGCASPPQAGNAGADGHPDDTMAAGGVAIQSGCGEQGGSGAFAALPASAGSLVACTGQAGGGGGSVGHIVFRADVVNQTGVVSPAARTLGR